MCSENEALGVGDGCDKFAGRRKFGSTEIVDELELQGGWRSTVLRGSRSDVERDGVEDGAGFDGQQVVRILGVLGSQVDDASGQKSVIG